MQADIFGCKKLLFMAVQLATMPDFAEKDCAFFGQLLDDDYSDAE